jgi:lysophospholipase L1-like esterase
MKSKYLKRRDFIRTSLTAMGSVFIASPNFARIGPVLPKVLIIGDSISLGYTPLVKELLKGKAVVQHNPGNAEHTGTGLDQIDDWLGTTYWDVIHFNWGLWDLCYRHPDSTVYGNRDKINGELTHTVRVYKRNLKALVRIIKPRGRCLIWANTTPVPPGEAGRFEGDAATYNRVAMKIMNKHNIRINDLHSLMLPHMEKYQVRPGDVHFTTEGYGLLAEQVAGQIGACL